MPDRNKYVVSSKNLPSEQAKDTSLWRTITNPAEMFSDLPYEVAVILYSCIVIGIFIVFLLFMWLCTSLAARQKSKNKSSKLRDKGSEIESKTKGKPPWSITGRKRSNEACDIPERRGGNVDTLKHLESMPWWDFVSSTPGVNWYDYYRMVEGKNRSKTCERRRYPLHSRDMRRSHERPKHFRADSKHRLPSDADPGWERVRPRTVELPRCWGSPKTHDTRFFPRFRMIPRASWSNERLLGSLSPGSLSDDYGNHSLASLTSADMQIMQMIAKRQRYVRPNRGDVFFGQYVGPLYDGAGLCHSRHISRNSSAHRISPYDLHNQNVARRQASDTQSYHTQIPIASSPLQTFSRGVDGSVHRMPPSPTLPSPPAYPPPPTPIPPRNDIEL